MRMYPLVTDVFLRLKAPYQKVSCFAAAAAMPVLHVAAQLLLVPCQQSSALSRNVLHQEPRKTAC